MVIARKAVTRQVVGSKWAMSKTNERRNKDQVRAST
jgi:hypothetical protein